MLTDAAVAATQLTIHRDAIRDILKFKKSFVKRLGPALSKNRENWKRSVRKMASSKSRRLLIRHAKAAFELHAGAYDCAFVE